MTALVTGPYLYRTIPSEFEPVECVEFIDDDDDEGSRKRMPCVLLWVQGGVLSFFEVMVKRLS